MLWLEAGDHIVLIYFGTPKPYSLFQEIYIELIPGGDYLAQGIWRIEITGEKVKAYLIKGTRKLNAYSVYPNKIAGFGALCLNNVINNLR
ncbi:MAG: hypothetical protein K6G88_04785 [Lachnospiraceae bacterium]|nr:hypothetical protein [Lachnospiraceae bacterium]